MNIKYDFDRKRQNRPYPPPSLGYQNYPPQNYQQLSRPPYFPNAQNNSSQPPSQNEVIVG